MRGINILGFIAGTLTTVSFLPQVYGAWTTKRCEDLSLSMLLAFGAGVLLWMVYGLWLRAAPVIAANVITLALILVLIVLKARYRAGGPASD
jgi:MtN3 and saliva related transmembrane protein